MTPRRYFLSYSMLPGAMGVGLALVLAIPLVRDLSISHPADHAATRSIRTDQRIDLPLDPTHADAPKPVRPVEPVKIAVSDENAPGLKPLTPDIAPVEIVPASAHPDLIWDATNRTLVEQGDPIANRVSAQDLPAAADRVALVRGLAGLVKASEQAVRLQPDQRVFTAGTRFNLSVPDVQDRSVIVLVVSGAGTLQFLYPSRRDPATVATPDLSFSVDVSEPFGADQIIAISSKQDLGDLVTSLRRLDQRKAAGDLLGFLDAVPNGTTKFGTTRIMTSR